VLGELVVLCDQGSVVEGAEIVQSAGHDRTD